MAQHRQTSFAAGELSPHLHGRQDLELYAHGARRLFNFVVGKQGQAVSRPGGRKFNEGKNAGQDIVLHPFLGSTYDTSYLLEFGNLYVRIYRSSVPGAPPIAELVTPFSTSNLRNLQFAQVGSVLVITDAQHDAQEITLSGGVFSIAPVRYAPPGSLAAVFPSINGDPPALPVLVQWQPGKLFFADAAHPPREWRWKVSTIVRDNTTGAVFETLPRDITEYAAGSVSSGIVGASLGALPTYQVVLYPDAPVYLEPGIGTAVGSSTTHTPIENLYYRGRGTLFGLVGRAGPAERFCDTGAEPDYLTPPLRGETPFAGFTKPTAVAHFQQRRCFTGPGNLWATSAVDDWDNWDKPVINWPGQPLEAQLVNRRREEPQAMGVLEHLFVLTDTSVWCVGRNDVPLDYDTLPAVTRVVDEHGAMRLAPLALENALLYVPSTGRGARAISVADGGAVRGSDVSWHAEHLFRGAGAALFGTTTLAEVLVVASTFQTGLPQAIVSWCYQREPWGCIWAVRSDGVLLTCTPSATGWAWAQHNVGARVISVCVVPRYGVTTGVIEDVFIAVRRGARTTIERITPFEPQGIPRKVDDPLYAGNVIGQEQQVYPLDSYIVVACDESVDTPVTGLDHLEGLDVWASCPGIEPIGPFRVTGGAITIPAGWGPLSLYTPTGSPPVYPRYASGNFYAAVGLAYYCDLELLDAPQARLNHKTVVKVGLEVDSAQGLEVGEDFDHLVPWLNRTPSDGYDFPSAASAMVVVSVRGAWRRSGRAALRQARPLPVTVLGVTRELEGGGT